jgi:diacylglycerol kinase
VTLSERALLFSVLQLILIVELINSAIEANTDHISLNATPWPSGPRTWGAPPSS